MRGKGWGTVTVFRGWSEFRGWAGRGRLRYVTERGLTVTTVAGTMVVGVGVGDVVG
jgi:hypothetical protein